MSEPDNEYPDPHKPPSLSIDNDTLSAPVTDHETVTAGGEPWNVTSGAAHAAGFETEKLVMICAAVVGGLVAGGLVVGAFVVCVTGLAVVAGVVAAAVVVAALATVVVVSATDVVVVAEPESIDVFDDELQPDTASAPSAIAAATGKMRLRSDVMNRTLRDRHLSDKRGSRRWSDR